MAHTQTIQKDGLWGRVFKDFSTFLQAEAHLSTPLSMARAFSCCLVGLLWVWQTLCSTLLPVEGLTACATLVLWLKWSASTCFVWSGFASTCFVLKQVGFCLDPQLIPLFQAKSNGCFILFVVMFDGTAAPLPTDLPLWDLPACLPSVCCCCSKWWISDFVFLKCEVC